MEPRPGPRGPGDPRRRPPTPTPGSPAGPRTWSAGARSMAPAAQPACSSRCAGRLGPLSPWPPARVQPGSAAPRRLRHWQRRRLQLREEEAAAVAPRRDHLGRKPAMPKSAGGGAGSGGARTGGGGQGGWGRIGGGACAPAAGMMQAQRGHVGCRRLVPAIKPYCSLDCPTTAPLDTWDPGHWDYSSLQGPQRPRQDPKPPLSDVGRALGCSLYM